MTKRIIIAIVVNVWLVLITAGCSTYFITRSILVADLDQTILTRVMSIPGVERSTALSLATPDEQDRYEIKTEDGRVLNPLVATTGAASRSLPPPVVDSAWFSHVANGSWLRTLEIHAYAQRVNPDEPPSHLTIVYSASADHLQSLLNNLLYSLTFFAILAAVVTAFAAHSVAKAALRPMRDASDAIGAIDERTLDRRIDVAKLPPELAPVGQRLNDMLARLETAFANRKQFLADASHELRTPVAALVTTLEVALRRRREADDYVKALDRCLCDAKLLHQLVVALIDQARVEQFGKEPELGPVAISKVLRECARVVEPLAQERQLDLSSDLPDDLIVLADEQLIRSCVGNLLSNAVEYTPQRAGGAAGGKITLSAQCEPGGAEIELPLVVRKAFPEGVKTTPCRLRISVEDNGPGIPGELTASIFEPFFRADAARTNAKEHLGLGLAMVQSHMRSLGGECTIQSPPPGKASGCLFALEIPTLQIIPGSLSNLPKYPRKEALEANAEHA